MTARHSASLALVLLLGCASKPPPPKPPPPVVEAPKPKPKVVEKPKPPPPPPPCEAIMEKCAAEKTTIARIAHTTELVFTPPLGWMYAQEPDASVAQVGDEGPGFALAAIEVVPKDVNKSNAAREAAVAALGKRLGITLPKQKINWKKADKTIDVGGHPFALHQIEGATRAGKKGPLLVFTTTLGDTSAIVGAGFVDDDDKTDADVAILESMKSITKPAPPAASSESLESKP
ncbi:MAG: hypothetical protein ABI175_02220 [Polyangiales bacterium]